MPQRRRIKTSYKTHQDRANESKRRRIVSLPSPPTPPLYAVYNTSFIFFKKKKEERERLIRVTRSLCSLYAALASIFLPNDEETLSHLGHGRHSPFHSCSRSEKSRRQERNRLCNRGRCPKNNARQTAPERKTLGHRREQKLLSQMGIRELGAEGMPEAKQRKRRQKLLADMPGIHAPELVRHLFLLSVYDVIRRIRSALALRFSTSSGPVQPALSVTSAPSACSYSYSAQPSHASKSPNAMQRYPTARRCSLWVQVQ